MRHSNVSTSLIAWCALGVAVGGCDFASAESGDVAGGGAASLAEEPALVGELTGETPSGSEIRIALTPDPPIAGDLQVRIEVSPPPSDADEITLDLVAPEMPAHGVTRHTAVRTEDSGRFVANVPVPMEGAWQLYVNLDIGLDAAAFHFQVEAAEEAAEDPGVPAHEGGAPGHGGDDAHRLH